MSRRCLVVLAAALLILPCCEDSGPPPTGPPDDGGLPSVPDSLPLDRPAQWVSSVPPQNPFVYDDGRYLHGAYALEQFPSHRVTTDLQRASFRPVTSPGSNPTPAEAAYAIFGFDMTLYDGDSVATLCWQEPPPDTGTVFIGLGNFALDRWDWFAAPPPGPRRLPHLAPYTSTHPYLLLAVVLTGNREAKLEGVQIGSRWVVGGVDLSLLCAPVMRFEAEALEADWAARNPVMDAFEEVGQLEDEDGSRQYLVAHRVDGYRHYGGVVVPPVKAFKKLPVLVLCHPGDAGTSLADQSWFFGSLGDPAIRQRFVQVIPSFRGESLDAGTLGRFRSEGPPSLFDRDADDAIALLDCVLRFFSNADSSRVLSAGYSRGGQVAMRIAQRDPRIRGVIDFCGMSDEWTINGQGYIRNFLEEERPEPAPFDSYYHTLWDLRRGACDVWHSRAVLIRSCIVYHAPRLPKLQIHHGVLDRAVPIHEAERLVAVLATIPGANYEYFRYPNGDHGILSLVGAGAQVQEFLRPFWN